MIQEGKDFPFFCYWHDSPRIVLGSGRASAKICWMNKWRKEESMILWEEVCNLKTSWNQEKVGFWLSWILVDIGSHSPLGNFSPIFFWDTSPPTTSLYGLPGADSTPHSKEGSDTLGHRDWFWAGHAVFHRLGQWDWILRILLIFLAWGEAFYPQSQT